MHWIYLAFLVMYAACCVYGIEHNAGFNAQNGWRAYLMPGGVSWVLQLVGIIFVYVEHWNPLHLVWWYFISSLVYTMIYRLLWKTGIIENPFIKPRF